MEYNRYRCYPPRCQHRITRNSSMPSLTARKLPQSITSNETEPCPGGAGNLTSGALISPMSISRLQFLRGGLIALGCSMSNRAMAVQETTPTGGTDSRIERSLGFPFQISQDQRILSAKSARRCQASEARNAGPSQWLLVQMVHHPRQIQCCGTGNVLQVRLNQTTIATAANARTAHSL